MLKKHFPTIVFFILLIGMFWSVWVSPSLTSAFLVAIILIFLGVSIYSILEKYRGAENRRQKITRDILILIFTLILIVLLGGLAGTFVGRQAQAQFGAQAGLLCALIVSFVVGYLVNKASSKLLDSRA